MSSQTVMTVAYFWPRDGTSIHTVLKPLVFRVQISAGLLTKENVMYYEDWVLDMFDQMMETRFALDSPW